MFKSPSSQPLVALCRSEKWSVAKRWHFIILVISVLLFSSCRKETLSNAALNSTLSGTPNEASLAVRNTPVVKYGTWILPDMSFARGSQEYLNFEVSVSNQLGVTCLREGVLVPNNAGADPVPQLNTRYKILLNFNSPRPYGTKQKAPFRTDITQYKKDLNNVLDKFKVMPVVAVIENEESNKNYFSGTANEYVRQLNAAIEVMHARSINVANAGITSVGLSLLVYKDLRKQGKYDSARQFKNLTHVEPDSVTTQERSRFIDTLLTNYRTMNLDYVNFHWKDSFPGTQALNQAINYLKKRTGKRIISNEIGALLPDANVLLTHVQLCTDQKFPYILWFSPDESLNLRGSPLQYPDGTLTPSGVAYKNYLADK